MDAASKIARLIGPVFCVIGISMLANSDAYGKIGAQFIAGYPFIYMSGVLVLLAGLAILNAHHGWTRDWRSTITAIGWALTIIGTFRLVGLQFVSFIGSNFLPHSAFFLGAGVFFLALGGFLSFKGYVA